MSARLISVVLLIAATCGPFGSGSQGHVAVNYQILSEAMLEPDGSGPPISAATSISQLVALMVVHQPGHPSPEDCCWPGAKASEPSLFLAFGKPGRSQCFVNHLGGIYLAGQALVVEIDEQQTGCVLHPLPPSPVLLVAIPLSDLPHDVLEIRLHRVGDAEERSHFPWDWTAIADLRRPLTNASVSVRDIQAGVDAAWQAMAPDEWEVSEVSIRRWSADDRPCGLPTTTAAHAGDPLGVVVRVMYSPNDGHVPWIAKQHEFVWRTGEVSSLNDCGVAA